jgi:hypothetical protein
LGGLCKQGPKGAAQVTDWNCLNALTKYRICGSAADLLKFAMVNIAAAMPADCHMVATVQDELILDAPVETAAFCRQMVEDRMRGRSSRCSATRSRLRYAGTGARNELLAQTALLA